MKHDLDDASLCVRSLSPKITKKVSVPPHFEYFLVDVTPFFVKNYAAKALFTCLLLLSENLALPHQQTLGMRLIGLNF